VPTDNASRQHRASLCVVDLRVALAAMNGAVLDPDESGGVDVGAGGVADLSGGDASDPVGPGDRLVEGQAPPFQLDDPLDGLVIENSEPGERRRGDDRWFSPSAP